MKRLPTAVFFVLFFAAQVVFAQHPNGTNGNSCHDRVEVMGGQTHDKKEFELRLSKCLPKHFSTFADFLRVGKRSGLDGGLKLQISHGRTWGINLLSGLEHLDRTRGLIGAEAEAEYHHWRFGALGVLGGRFGRVAEFGVETPKLKSLGNVRLGPVARFTPHGAQFLGKLSFEIH